MTNTPPKTPTTKLTSSSRQVMGSQVTGVNRRKFMQRSAASLAATTVISSSIALPAFAAERTVKIGFVSPQTGPLAPFGEADSFVIDAIAEFVAGGVTIGGKKHPVDIIVKDSQSNVNRAAEVASDLILNDEIDLMLVASTPETTTPSVTNVKSMACHVFPRSHHGNLVFLRGGEMGKGFDYTFHFFWGLEDIITTFNAMWSKLDTNKMVGGAIPQ